MKKQFSFKIVAFATMLTLCSFIVAAFSWLNEIIYGNQSMRFLIAPTACISIGMASILCILGWYLIKAKLSIVEHALCASALLPPLALLGAMSNFYPSDGPTNIRLLVVCMMVALIVMFYLLLFIADYSRTAAILMLPIAIINSFTFIVPAIILILFLFRPFGH